jgi:hypothetical protein
VYITELGVGAVLVGGNGILTATSLHSALIFPILISI